MSSVLDRLGATVLRTRRLVRAPIWLYRHRLGWLLGRRVLMIEHTGRRTGRPRFVCVEVVERPSRHGIVVVSGFGGRAQWYRNLRAHPGCRVSTGFAAHVPARAELMDDADSAAALERYQRAHPRAWRRLRGMIEHATGHPIAVLPMVTLHLEPSGGAGA